jgi:hypothetical protein
MPTIDCESGLGALERTRINLSLAARPLEDAISRMARSQRGVRFATGCPARSGLLRAKATFDSSSTVADHIRRLSRLAGFVVYPTPQDELFVGQWKPLKTAGPAGAPTSRQVTHDLSPETVLSAVVEPVPEPRPRHALTFSDPRGKNEGLLVVSRKSIDAQISGKRRPGSGLNVVGLSPKGAKKALENVFRMENVEARLRLETLGAPEVRLGDAVRFGDLGPGLVTEVRHTLDGERGFTTRVTASIFRSPRATKPGE